MANEAAVTMVMRMRDEASPKLKNVGQTMEQTQVKSLQFGLALTTLGSAMGALGGLMGQIDHPMAKMLQNFLMLGSAAILSISAIGQLIPVLKGLTGVTRALAVAKAFLLGLSGPAGWAMLGAGLALGAGAAVAVTAATGGFSGGAGTPAGQGNVTHVNINGPVMGNEQEARQFARKIQSFNREDSRVGR
jgi:hypothetical protein